MTRWPALRSLRHRNFRLYSAGQLVSLSGTRMQLLAQSWLVYRLTDSSLMLGLVGAAGFVPSLLFGLYGGVLADRLPQRRLLIAGQLAAMTQAVVLATLTLSGLVLPWHILVLALLLGFVQAVEIPTRYSFLPALVGREDLPNAVALNAGLFHLARFSGPPLAGVLVAWIGEGPVFLVNGLSFVAVIAALLAIRLPRPPGAGERPGARGGIGDGLRFARRHRPVRNALALVAAVSLVGSSIAVLMPVYAARVFHSGPESLGLLLGAMGVGALGAALRLAHRGNAGTLGRAVARAGVGAGVLLLLLAATSDRLWPALVLLLLLGFCLTTVLASSNALIQLAVPDELRGRVMSMYSVALHGLLPVGFLAIGAAAEFLGPRPATAICGALLVAAALAYRVAPGRQGAAGP